MCPLLSAPVVELYRLKLSPILSRSFGPLCISIVGHLCTSIVMYNTVPLEGLAGWEWAGPLYRIGGGVLSDDTAVFNMKQSVSWVCFVFTW